MSRGAVPPVGPPTGPPGDDAGCPVLHVDMDAFYASVSLLARPDLRGQPVIVGGGGTRGVVLSATYEARVHGVHSAMPMMRARRMCPQAVVLAPDHDAYARASHGVMEVFRSITPLVEPISLDEAFLDVRGAARRLGGPRQIGEWIRATVEDEQGITCSVGVASTKFVAKLASARCKPDGLLVVPADDVVAFLHPLPVGALWGVGDKTEQVLSALGLHTVGDLAHTPVATLERALGPAVGKHLSALAWGRDERSVVPHEPDKSIGAENTFGTDVDDPAVVSRELLRLSERTAARLARFRAGRSYRLDQGPLRRLHHHHPQPHPARGHRRRPGRLRHRDGAVRRPGAGTGPDPAHRRAGGGGRRRRRRAAPARAGGARARLAGRGAGRRPGSPAVRSGQCPSGNTGRSLRQC